jgi:hypothetical protein
MNLVFGMLKGEETMTMMKNAQKKINHLGNKEEADRHVFDM